MSRSLNPSEIFALTREAAIRRTIARVRKKEQLDAQKVTNDFLSEPVYHSKRTGILETILKKALETQGRQVKNLPSIRLKAPDTGGRPFHFAHRFVNQTNAKPATEQKSGKGFRKGGKGASGSGRKTASGAKKSGSRKTGADINASDEESSLDKHQRYIERETVLQDGRSIDFTILDAGCHEPDPITGEGRFRRPADLESMNAPGVADGRVSADNVNTSDRICGENASAVAMQAYIENASKVDPANQTTGTTNSFGTLGTTPEERAEFWRLTEEAAPKNGRLQNRITLELPHEANDRSRFLIMREFAKEFEDAGIPYWVAIHKPTKDNDSRNYHAHIIYGPRPAKKIINPKTGKLEWDFSIVETYISKCNHERRHRPYKQTKPDKIYDIHNVKNQRIKFSRIVNRVMTEEQSDVRYDPRSYKGMGLDIAPMKNVRRIIADKSKSAKFAVMDSEWTRRMINQEIVAAAERRDASWVKIQDVEHAIEAATERYSGIRKHKNRLPRSIRLSEHEVFLAEKSRLAMIEGRKIERDKLARRLMNEATVGALTSIIKATDTKRAPGSRKPMKSLDPEISIEDLDRLHAAAQYELALHCAKMKEDDSVRRQDLWDESGALNNGGFLAHRNDEGVKHEPEILAGDAFRGAINPRYPPGDAPAVFSGREDPHCARWPAG